MKMLSIVCLTFLIQFPSWPNVQIHIFSLAEHAVNKTVNIPVTKIKSFLTQRQYRYTFLKQNHQVLPGVKNAENPL